MTHPAAPNGPIPRKIRLAAEKAKREKAAHTRRILLAEMFGTTCHDCGAEGQPGTSELHFHHRDPASFSFHVTSVLGGRSWATILAEARKCDLVCPRCHRARHESLRSPTPA